MKLLWWALAWLFALVAAIWLCFLAYNAMLFDERIPVHEGTNTLFVDLQVGTYLVRVYDKSSINEIIPRNLFNLKSTIYVSSESVGELMPDSIQRDEDVADTSFSKWITVPKPGEKIRVELSLRPIDKGEFVLRIYQPR